MERVRLPARSTARWTIRFVESAGSHLPWWVNRPEERPELMSAASSQVRRDRTGQVAGFEPYDALFVSIQHPGEVKPETPGRPARRTIDSTGPARAWW